MARDAEDDKKSGVSARDARLKAALRENLRRRKAQARGRAGEASPEAGSHGGATQTQADGENER